MTRDFGVRWIVTFYPDDGKVIHVMVHSSTEAADVSQAVLRIGKVGTSIERVPATWSCDGRDGCMVQA